VLELRGLSEGYGELVAGWAGYSELFLRVRPDNAVAVRTYQRVGFVDVPAGLMDEWNAGQPIAYRWMRFAGG
jgi:[ribosomal protein S18]-alanine N-acetyltransferase